MCQQMLSWAVDVTKGSSGDLLELYCGNGNFTLPLAQNFKQVCCQPAGSTTRGSGRQLASLLCVFSTVCQECCSSSVRPLPCTQRQYCLCVVVRCWCAGCRGVQVVATEVSKGSVAAARHNIEANSVSNIFMARMSSEEFVETWRVKGSRQRLTGLDWEQLQLQTLLVDPPRCVCVCGGGGAVVRAVTVPMFAVVLVRLLRT